MSHTGSDVEPCFFGFQIGSNPQKYLVDVSVVNLFGCRRADVDNLDIEVQRFPGERVVHIQLYLGIIERFHDYLKLLPFGVLAGEGQTLFEFHIGGNLFSPDGLGQVFIYQTVAVFRCNLDRFLIAGLEIHDFPFETRNDLLLPGQEL